jgi:hypothetical protein
MDFILFYILFRQRGKLLLFLGVIPYIDKLWILPLFYISFRQRGKLLLFLGVIPYIDKAMDSVITLCRVSLQVDSLIREGYNLVTAERTAGITIRGGK